jgi:hypothetical protein
VLEKPSRDGGVLRSHSVIANVRLTAHFAAAPLRGLACLLKLGDLAGCSQHRRGGWPSA